jgi:radical SAM superfamily enzyme YgiQ (UPF0313 family)
MKLKLIFLPWYHRDPCEENLYGAIGFPPLGIATLTGYLRRHGIHVEQDDLDTKVVWHNERSSGSQLIDLKPFLEERRQNKLIEGGEETLEREGEKMLRLTDWKGFDVIGFSLHSTDNPSVTGVALTLGKLLKERYDVTIIMGNLAERSAQEKMLGSGFIDCAILSSDVASLGEVNLLKFCQMYESGTDLFQIPGTIHMQGGRLVHTRNFKDYSSDERCVFTLPDFEGLPLDLYRYHTTSRLDGDTYSSQILILPYFFIYGCPHGCIYCTYSLHPLLGLKDPQMVAEDLELLSKKYHTRYFFFLNTEINPTKKYAQAVTEEIKKRDLNLLWTDCATFKTMDGKLLRNLKEAGAARLVWGLESGSQRVLDYIRKGIALSKAEACLKESWRLGIWNQIEMICGFPYERAADVKRTITFLKKNKMYIGEMVLNKFFISGLLEHRPHEHGIRLRKSSSIYRAWSTRPFDEIAGLPWEDKMRQTSRFYDELRRASLRFGIADVKPIHHIFHLATLDRDYGIRLTKERVLRTRVKVELRYGC